MSQAKTNSTKPAIPLEIVAQMDAAADAALKCGLTPMRVKEIFMYTFLQRAVERYATQSNAARKLGTTPQWLNSTLQRLEVRLAH